MDEWHRIHITFFFYRGVVYSAKGVFDIDRGQDKKSDFKFLTSFNRRLYTNCEILILVVQTKKAKQKERI